MIDEREIRLRCIEAAARNPDHRSNDGLQAAVLEAAKCWSDWVISGQKAADPGVAGLL